MKYFWIMASISWVVSLWLVVNLWRSNDSVFFKVFITPLALIPVLGPFFYLFTTDRTPPQRRCLQNRGARGQYTHTWIGMSPLYKKILKKKQEQLDAQDKENT